MLNLPHVVTKGDLVVVGPINSGDTNGIFKQLAQRLDAAGAKQSELAYVRTYANSRDVRQSQEAAFDAYFKGVERSKRPVYYPLVLTELPVGKGTQLSHAFAVKGSTPNGQSAGTQGQGADIAVRGPLFFSAGLNGLVSESGSKLVERGPQVDRLYKVIEQRLNSIDAGFDDLIKVNTWISEKSSKDLALVGWKRIFGTADDGAREKTPARTFLIHSQPALDDDVLVEAELIGVVPA